MKRSEMIRLLTASIDKHHGIYTPFPAGYDIADMVLRDLEHAGMLPPSTEQEDLGVARVSYNNLWDLEDK